MVTPTLFLLVLGGENQARSGGRACFVKCELLTERMAAVVQHQPKVSLCLPVESASQGEHLHGNQAGDGDGDRPVPNTPGAFSQGSQEAPADQPGSRFLALALPLASL